MKIFLKLKTLSNCTWIDYFSQVLSIDLICQHWTLFTILLYRTWWELHGIWWKLHRTLWKLQGTHGNFVYSLWKLHGTLLKLNGSWWELHGWLKSLIDSISLCGYHLILFEYVHIFHNPYINMVVVCPSVCLSVRPSHFFFQIIIRGQNILWSSPNLHQM